EATRLQVTLGRALGVPECEHPVQMPRDRRIDEGFDSTVLCGVDEIDLAATIDSLEGVVWLPRSHHRSRRDDRVDAAAGSPQRERILQVTVDQLDARAS